MTQQPLFPDAALPASRLLNRTDDGHLACMFGEPWLGPHPLCEAHARQLAAKVAA